LVDMIELRFAAVVTVRNNKDDTVVILSTVDLKQHLTQHETKLYMLINVTIDDIYAVKGGVGPTSRPLNVWVRMMLFDIHLYPIIDEAYRIRVRCPGATANVFLKHDRQFRESSCAPLDEFLYGRFVRSSCRSRACLKLSTAELEIRFKTCRA
jgi:hypothetical protein